MYITKTYEFTQFNIKKILTARCRFLPQSLNKFWSNLLNAFGLSLQSSSRPEHPIAYTVSASSVAASRASKSNEGLEVPPVDWSNNEVCGVCSFRSWAARLVIPAIVDCLMFIDKMNRIEIDGIYNVYICSRLSIMYEIVLIVL